MTAIQRISLALLVLKTFSSGPLQAADWLVYQGAAGPGLGKHIVFLSGDEEYRSEESLPMLAKILAFHHGFKCTVLFAIDPATHLVAPDILTNIPGMDALDSADVCVMALRFRELPDPTMKHFVDYLNSGKPLIALRTSTHAFQYLHNRQSRYAKYDWRSTSWQGGFGQQVLGETWVSHHGEHGKESTRGIIVQANSPVLRGVSDIWGPTDVYTVAHLPTNASVLVLGQVLSGMEPSDSPVEGSKNNPMMPVVWARTYLGEQAKSSKILTITMGAAVDFQNESLRRLVVNGCYWAAGLQDQIPPKADVRYVGEYHPHWFGFGGYARGKTPKDF